MCRQTLLPHYAFISRTWFKDRMKRIKEILNGVWSSKSAAVDWIWTPEMQISKSKI